MTVLIVEDNEQMRRMIKGVITDLAESIVEHADGRNAVTYCNSHCPDWILMDIRMPLMDGIAALRLIRETCPRTPVVMVTSFDDDELREAARQAGATDYVLKDNLMRLRELLTAH